MLGDLIDGVHTVASSKENLQMLNMDFASFLTLLIISLIGALVMHYTIRYRMLDGIDGFFAKWTVGWIGAWLGSAVLGHWFAGVNLGHVYIIPAFIGAFIGAFAPAAWWKGRARALQPRTFEVNETHKAA
jgi:uncharacterized membrane protein YeaQ/YmgE (transglycosylase-associated protein family)